MPPSAAAAARFVICIYSSSSSTTTTTSVAATTTTIATTAAARYIARCQLCTFIDEDFLKTSPAYLIHRHALMHDSDRNDPESKAWQRDDLTRISAVQHMCHETRSARSSNNNSRRGLRERENQIKVLEREDRSMPELGKTRRYLRVPAQTYTRSLCRYHSARAYMENSNNTKARVHGRSYEIWERLYIRANTCPLATSPHKITRCLVRSCDISPCGASLRHSARVRQNILIPNHANEYYTDCLSRVRLSNLPLDYFVD
ncbi:unnamed protein product [Trichogramma brassicae]|uniref:Uncharacterized protein n=1 Tax=Trichogramma brassicae TaxID=86971 RepID=A0A6H5I1U7_9HYME|nr:unnamed protein product [Trichogramma brassicae]